MTNVIGKGEGEGREAKKKGGRERREGNKKKVGRGGLKKKEGERVRESKGKRREGR